MTSFNRRYTHVVFIITVYTILLLAARWTFLLQIGGLLGEKTDNQQVVSPRIQRTTNDTLSFLPRPHRTFTRDQIAAPPRPHRTFTRDQIAAPPHQKMFWPEVKTIKRKRSSRRKIIDSLKAVFTNFLHA